MVIYGKISIRVFADEREINGPDELALSDRLHELEIKVDEWLANEMGTEFPEFDFTVEGG